MGEELIEGQTIDDLFKSSGAQSKCYLSAGDAICWWLAFSLDRSVVKLLLRLIKRELHVLTWGPRRGTWVPRRSSWVPICTQCQSVRVHRWAREHTLVARAGRILHSHMASANVVHSHISSTSKGQSVNTSSSFYCSLRENRFTPLSSPTPSSFP